MFGALITAPVHEEADLGVIFMDSGGYLNMCGHGSIGTASMAVETGLVEVREPYTTVILDTPSGMIHTCVTVKEGKAEKVSILNVPSFLYKEEETLEIDGFGKITFDISFGGSFFALVDARQIGLQLVPGCIAEITELGMKLREKINQEIPVIHPYLDITNVDLVEFYGDTQNPKADLRNCVIFGSAQSDRSPCGTGTSAKMAALYAKGKLKLKEPFVYESIMGSLFTGRIVSETTVMDRRCIIPEITGSAYITGLNNWILDEKDPLEAGFLPGKSR